MGDCNEFYVIFYTYIDNSITNFINRDQNVHNIISMDEKKKHILTNLFTQNNNTDNHLINMIGNNLNVYLNMIHFVKERDIPFMPVLIDFTQLNYVFNRFLYHYARLCMNNECIFSGNIYMKIMNLQNVQN